MPLEVDRRKFFKLGLGVTGALALGGVSLLGKTSAQSISTVESIRKFESQVGSNPLTFEQARSYVPLITKFFTENVPSQKSAPELASRTVIITRGFAKDEVVEWQRKTSDNPDSIVTSPPAKKLFLDYPELRPDFDVVDGLTQMLRSGYGDDLLGWSTGERVYLPLHALNSQRSAEIHMSQLIPVWQYHLSETGVNCSTPSAAVRFRSTMLHELIHLDTASREEPVEPELIDSIRRVLPGLKLKAAIKSGFVTALLSELKPQPIIDSSFNESITDYLMAQININHGLSFTSNYLKPPDVRNFGHVFKQSELSDGQLYKLLIKNQLKEFINQISNQVMLEKQNERFDFIVSEMVANPWNAVNRRIRWRHLAPYFDNLDTTIFDLVNEKDHWQLENVDFLFTDRGADYLYKRENHFCAK